MLNFRIIEGKDNKWIFSTVHGMPIKMHRKIRNALYQSGKDLVAEAKRVINEKPKHGRKYLKRMGIGRYGAGKRFYGSYTKPTYYTASAPGEAPAVVTGRLRSGIGFKVSGSDKLAFYSGNVPYAKYLEYTDLVNSKNDSQAKKVQPRPYLSAAIGKYKDKIRERLEQATREPD
jgi:hypothetical protein